MVTTGVSKILFFKTGHFISKPNISGPELLKGIVMLMEKVGLPARAAPFVNKK